jgi:hypothetical protein
MRKLFVFILFASVIGLSATPTPAPENLPKPEAETFVIKIHDAMDSNWILRKVKPYVFKLAEEEGSGLESDFSLWDDQTISSVEIQQSEVFQPDSSATQAALIKKLIALGNRIHPQTRIRTIRNNLFFGPGDILRPYLLKSNLNYLHKQGIFSEMQFIVSASETDSITVTTHLRDRFAYYAGLQYVSENDLRLKLNDQNFLGLGHRLSNTWYLDPGKPGSVGWESSYLCPNIAGSFIQGDLSWKDLPGNSSQKLELHRPFLHPLFHASGGIDLSKTFIHPPQDSIDVDKFLLGGWYAYSFQVPPLPQYAYGALSLEKSWYRKRPEVAIACNEPWHQGILAIGSLAITKSAYLQMDQVSSFLDNDYIPVGHLLELLGGYEFGEFRDRRFMGIRSSYAQRLQNGAFFYLKGSAETFIALNQAEQGVIALEPLFISPVKSYGKFSAISFVRGRLIMGVNRWKTESLRMSSDPYFRGAFDLEGDNLCSLGLEQDINCPWKLLGLGISLFAFGDLALVADDFTRASPEDMLLTEGLGIRIYHPHLIWDYLELQLSLNQSQGYKPGLKVNLSTKAPLKLKDFEGTRPRPYDFR